MAVDVVARGNWLAVRRSYVTDGEAASGALVFARGDGDSDYRASYEALALSGCRDSLCSSVASLPAVLASSGHRQSKL